MQDYAFYSANSGLTPAGKYSLDDHFRAWLVGKTGKSFGSAGDLSAALYNGQGGERGYYLTQLSLTDTGQPLSLLQAAYFASGGGPVVPPIPTPAVSYSNAMTTNGALPTGWTASKGGGSATIANNKGSFTSTGMSNYSAAQTSLNAASVAPLSSVDVRFDTGVANTDVQYSYVSFGGDGVNYYPGGGQNGMPKNGYLLQFRTADNVILVLENFSARQLASIPWTFVPGSDNISVRITMTGYNIAVRVWTKGNAEPTTPTYNGPKQRLDQQQGYLEVGMLNATTTTATIYLTNLVLTNLFGTASQVSTMPTTGIISNGKTWNQVVADDFNVASTTPRDPARMAEYQMYDDYTGAGKYRDNNVTYASSCLNIQLRYQNNLSAISTPSGAAGVLFNRSFVGGRFQMRVRADKTAAGYGAAIFLFPANNVWDEGELDYPEGNFDVGIAINQHILNGGGNDAALTYGSGIFNDWNTWHIVTIEWVPSTSIRYYCDGILLYEELTPANVPSTPHNWIIQAATPDGATPPVGSAGYLQCDWAVVWQ